jgi:MoxR-like ATPase
MSTARLDHGMVFGLGGVALRFLLPTALVDGAVFEGKPFEDQEQAIEDLSNAHGRIVTEVGKVIVGQTSVLEQVLVALFARGHCLLIGAPGLAKTLLVRTVAGTLDLQFRRIQFTPDLMPADITGTDILEEDPAGGRRRFRFNHGPLFTNVLLADEINRTPPKTQAALLEAMQEQRVTAAGVTYDLPQPFIVLATQNPIELEGTYPLPEAQLDRFMFSVLVDYPEREEEHVILMETTRDVAREVDRLLDAEAILRFQHLVRQVPVSEHVARYASALVRASRPTTDEAEPFVKQWIRWGAGPRAGQYLLLAAKAHAILNGGFSVSCEDIRRYAAPVMRHRIFLNFAAASENVSTDDIITRLIKVVDEPEY